MESKDIPPQNVAPVEPRADIYDPFEAYFKDCRNELLDFLEGGCQGIENSAREVLSKKDN